MINYIKNKINGIKHIKKYYLLPIINRKKVIESLKKINYIKINKKRCFILGNGPSIKNINLKKLDNEDIFLCNRGYYLEELGLKLENIKYYVIADDLVYYKDKKNIDKKTKNIEYKFISENIKTDNYNFIYFKRNKSDILKNGYNISNFQKGFFSGGTVVFDALQIAISLGYKEIFFLGIDMNYNLEKKHFYSNKNGVDTSYEKNNHYKFPYKKVFETFKIINKKVKTKGINLYNATEGSGLKELKAIKYDDIFKK